MENKKGTTVLLTVIGIATLLVAVVGATFAYFTATVEPTNDAVTNVTVTAAQLGTVTFNNGNIIDLCGRSVNTNVADGDKCVIYPGATETLDFTLDSDAESSVNVDYVVTLDILSNTFPESEVDEQAGKANLQYKVWTDNETATNMDGTAAIATSEPAAQWVAFTPEQIADIVLAKAVLSKQSSDEWHVAVRLNETGATQNLDQNKEFTAKIVVTTDTTYTTTDTANDKIGPYVNPNS